MKSMNEVSIIINGVRYDAVESKTGFGCEECDLIDLCEQKPFTCICPMFDLGETKCFKESDKRFEK